MANAANESTKSKAALRPKDETETGRKSVWARYKWVIIGLVILLIVVAVVLLIVFLVVKPGSSKSSQPASTINFEYGPPDLKSNPSNLGSYDDNAQVNPHVPKLTEPFPYRQTPVRGVNLGGWLVLEPFITPSLFERFDPEDKVIDEWTLCAKLGRDECRKVLEKHYNEFLTEDDIKKIAGAGLNHVRIPVGYWALDIDETKEPFVYGAWYYLLRGIQWARKYGIRVMVEFHGAPGSQNGWNHSGRYGKVRFLNQTDPNSPQMVARFNTILKNTANFFKQPQWSNVVTMFGVLNEPAIYLTNNTEGVRQWYKDSYNVIRNNGNEGPALVFHEGFLGIKKWQGFMPNNTYKRVTIDTHNYLIFDKDLVRLPLADQVSFPCKSWKPDFIESDSKFGWTMCGEFSVATNDCGYWLNGVGLGARYEGTYQLEPGPAACPTCTCKNDGDYKSFTTDKKNLLLRFMELQMDAFEQSLGWFFWNFKTENHVNPFWDYFLALDQGWAPKDASQRTNKC